jgi:hypothetical protein
VVHLVRRRKVFYVVTGTLAIAAIAAIAADPSWVASSIDTAPGVRLSAAPLGLNVPPWDGVYTSSPSVGGRANVMQPLLSAADIRQLRYGGGGWADFYDWQTDTDIGGCLPAHPTASFTSSCASNDPLNFAQFSRQARAIGADSFVTVNYGSGTPVEAAAWVAAATHTSGEGVALWEVGNESYGCWEVNNELAGPPANYKGYKAPAPSQSNPANPTCPQISEGNAAGTQTLATSYAVNAQRFMQAMKAVGPAVKIGVPWAFGDSVPGAYVPDSSEWNNTVLRADAKYVSFVDAHYYPFWFSGGTGGHNPTDEQVLRVLGQIPALYRGIRAELNTYDPGASVVIGETAVSAEATTTVCTPVGALFAAGDALSWLAAGAESVDWWNINSYGNQTDNCVEPDFGFFTSSSHPVVETPYYGYLLASQLAQPGALLATLATSDPSDVLAFQSALPSGGHAVAFINTDTKSARTVTFHLSDALSGTLRTWRYGSHTGKLSTGTVSAASVSGHITVPAESIVVLETR